MPDEAHRREIAALKLALLGTTGASIEWYDFFIYATAAALVFPSVFFPASLPRFLALIASFSTFTVGFLARPMGAVVFGHMGDRLGRKAALAASLILMGTATTLIGLLPSYTAVGVLAPVALVLLRLTQGFAVGGQWGGAILLATENAPPEKRGYYGSIVQTSVPIGVILANLAILIADGTTSPATFLAYAWRIPFLLSFVLVALGMFVEFKVEDTEAFRLLKRRTAGAGAAAGAAGSGRRRSPVLEALSRHPRLILLAGGAYISTPLSFYILITYVVSYGTSLSGLHLPRSMLLTAVLLANVAGIFMLIGAGRLSDRYGRRRIFMSGVALTGVWAFAIFPLLDTRNLLLIGVALFVGGAVNSMAFGPLAAMFTEFFGTQVRYSAASLAYQIGAILGGGLAPVIATALYQAFHSNLGVSAYIAGACLVSLVCANRLEETYRSELKDVPERMAAAEI